MRILRGKSNLEVSSQGFALFVLGLILATFLGGAVRTILSSDRVHTRIVTELKSRFPRNEFQIGRTEVLLSRGLWPGLGLRLRDVTFRQDVCGKLSFVLDVPQMVLPVDLLSLRHGRVRLGTVGLEGAKMHLDYKDCPPKTPESAVASAPASQGIRSAVAEKGIKPPQVDWEQWSQHVEALELRDAKITYERNITWKLIVKKARVHLGPEMSLSAAIDVQKSLPFGTLNHVVELEAEGTGQDLQWNVHSEFKEGNLSWSGEWNLAQNAARSKVQLVQIPLKDLSSELHQMGFTDHEVKLKTAWLTCQTEWAGNIQLFREAPLKFKACKLEGAYGRVDLDQAEMFMRAENQFASPAQFHVQKLQIQPLIESLGRQVLPAVLARLGVWSGVVNYSQPKAWDFNGHLENAEIVFSNQSVRGKQVVRRVHTQAKRAGEAVEGKLDSIELLDGEFAGEIAFQLTDSGRSGPFQVAIERLSFSPAIQNILVGGQIAPVKLSGKGELSGGELSQWNGTLTSADVNGDGWRGENVEMKSRFAPGAFTIEARAKRVTADSRWRLYPQLRVARADLGDVIHWKDMTAKLEVLRTGGNVQTLQAQEEGGPYWRAKGSWIRDGALNGTLMLGQSQVFAIRGEKNTLTIHDRQANESL